MLALLLLEGERAMLRYSVRRILFLVLVLWIVSALTFVIFVELPSGDPARRAAGHQTSARTIRAARRALGLDRPWYVQYARFAKGLVPWPGWFLNRQYYYSWANGVPVREALLQRLPVTITLALGGAVLWVLMGVPIGIISALRRGKLPDRAGMLFALFGVSAPNFWVAYVLLFVFWFKLHWAPPSGLPIGQSTLTAALHGYFILPWIVISLEYAALYARMIRGSLIEAMSEDYIRTARSKGLSERRVVFKHGLRSVLTPIATILGLDIGRILGGAVITETVFGLPGIGQYAVLSLTSNDFPSVMGVTVFGAFIIIVANLIVDVGYAFLDPRVRYA